MKDRLTKKEKKNFVFLSIICVTIIIFSVISSFRNFSSIASKAKEKDTLTKEYNKLKDDEQTLNDDIEKLKNPEYAARYARSKYFYSKTGEKILKID